MEKEDLIAVVQLAKEMRTAQKNYFKFQWACRRNPSPENEALKKEWLDKSKDLEKRFDAMADKATDPTAQKDLFGNLI